MLTGDSTRRQLPDSRHYRQRIADVVRGIHLARPRLWRRRLCGETLMLGPPAVSRVGLLIQIQSMLQAIGMWVHLQAAGTRPACG